MPIVAGVVFSILILKKLVQMQKIYKSGKSIKDVPLNIRFACAKRESNGDKTKN
jgi:hypothetical protein